MIRLIAASFLAFVAIGISSAADPRVAVPKEGNTSAEIYKAFGSRIGFGPVNSAELRSHGRELIAIWYCPTSGEAACYLHAWYFDPEKAKWLLLLDTHLRGTHDLSVELPVRGEELVFKDYQGKVVHRQSVAKLPAKDWEKKQ